MMAITMIAMMILAIVEVSLQLLLLMMMMAMEVMIRMRININLGILQVYSAGLRESSLASVVHRLGSHFFKVVLPLGFGTYIYINLYQRLICPKFQR